MFSILKPYIFSLDPETAHDLAIKSLKANFLPESFFSVKEEELLETNLLKIAKNRKIRFVDGLGMLIHQGVPGFEAWFGKTPLITEDLRELLLQ